MLLAVDPGMTTGVAVLNSQGEVILAAELSGDTDIVARALEPIICSDQVIEQGPASRDNAYLDDLDGRLREQFPEATWVPPSYWKGTPRSRTQVPDSSPHVRDAAHMGREYLHQHGFKLVTA